MKLNTIKLANTFALAAVVLWVLCSTIVWLFPKFSWQVTSWWLHGVDISILGSWNLTFGNFLLGGITMIGSAWFIGWVLGWSWQVVNGKK